MARKTISSAGSYWTGTSAKDKVYISWADSVSVNLGGGNDSLYDYLGYHATIDAGAGNDTIKLSYGNYSSVNAGDGNDKISLYGGGGTITVKGGTGNDTIYSSGYSVLHQYANGDGNDVIRNWSANDTLSITGGAWSSVTSGKNVIIRVGSGKITLKNAKGKKINIVGGGIHNTLSNTYVYGTSNADSITNSGRYVTIYAGDGDDTIYNEGISSDSLVASRVTIYGGAGRDSINNIGDNVVIDSGTGDDKITVNAWNDTSKSYGGWYTSVNAGDGNDTIRNYSANYVTIRGGAGNDSIVSGYTSYLGRYVTISGGTGNDLISLRSSGNNELIEYTSGDGVDTVYGFESRDTLKIGNGTTDTYSKATVGNDVVISVGSGSITLKNASGKSLNIKGSLIGGNGTVISNSQSYKTIYGTSYNDTIRNLGDTVKIYAGDGADSIYSYSYYGTISGGAGSDTVSLHSSGHHNIISYYSGDGNDIVYNLTATDSISIGGANYTRSTVGSNVVLGIGTGSITVNGGSSKTVNVIGTLAGSSNGTVISNYYDDEEVYGTSYNDTINNYGDGVEVYAYDGNDYIYNGYASEDFTINGGYGNDTICNYGDDGYIRGYYGDDFIYSFSYFATIDGDSGNDIISLSSSGSYNVINYYSGEGNDTVYNLGSTDSIKIFNGSYTRSTVGNDVVVKVGSGSITLKDMAGETINISYGSSANSAWFLEDDNNFSTDNDLSSLVESKNYLPDVQLETSTNPFKETQLLTYSGKK